MDPLIPLTATVAHDADGTTVVVLDGQLDLATAATAAEVFATLPSPTRVVIDASDLTFMDSSGLTVLLVAANRGLALQLRRPTDMVRRVIAASGLDETLPVEP
jgi:anti-anti-sigma factor